MNPPFEPLDGEMYHEIMTEIRHVRDGVSRVQEHLDRHIHQEDGQYSRVQSQLKQLSEDVVTLKTRWGILASIAAIVGAGVMAAIQKVFF